MAIQSQKDFKNSSFVLIDAFQGCNNYSITEKKTIASGDDHVGYTETRPVLLQTKLPVGFSNSDCNADEYLGVQNIT